MIWLLKVVIMSMVTYDRNIYRNVVVFQVYENAVPRLKVKTITVNFKDLIIVRLKLKFLCVLFSVV